MSLPIELTLQQFFLLIVIGGPAAVVGVMVPVQIASKLRRLRRRHTHKICRICGYRFLRENTSMPIICPQCSAHNK